MQVMLLIAAFLILTVGSFIWYVATWDQREAVLSPVPAQSPHNIGGLV